jgi:hypothetical protein
MNPRPAPPSEPDPDSTPTGSEAKQFTLRLPPVLHKILTDRAEETDRSLNQLILDACQDAVSDDGVAEITRERAGVLVQGDRGEQAWAAVAYLLSYLGAEADAARAWPWTQQFLGLGGASDLAKAGALAAAEIDRWREGQK